MEQVDEFIVDNGIRMVEFGEGDLKLRVGSEEGILFIETDEGSGARINLYASEATILAQLLLPFAAVAEAQVAANDDPRTRT